MPIGLGMLVSTRWVVLPIQPPAGSVHQGSNGLFPLGLLHLSCPGAEASDASGSADRSGSADGSGSGDGSSILFGRSGVDGRDAPSVPSVRPWPA